MAVFENHVKNDHILVWYTVWSGLIWCMFWSCEYVWKLVSLDFQVDYTVFPYTALQLSELFTSIRENENRSSEFFNTILYVSLGYWRNWDMSVKYSRQNNRHINQWLETVSKMLFIATFHQICIILMIDTFPRQTLWRKIIWKKTKKDCSLLVGEMWFNNHIILKSWKAPYKSNISILTRFLPSVLVFYSLPNITQRVCIMK